MIFRFRSRYYLVLVIMDNMVSIMEMLSNGVLINVVLFMYLLMILRFGICCIVLFYFLFFNLWCRNRYNMVKIVVIVRVVKFRFVSVICMISSL